MKNEQIINILLRTSNRPNLFRETLYQIKSQGYNNYNLLVSVDNLHSKEYVEKENIQPILLTKEIRKNENHNPYNLYFNELLKFVKNGWIWFIDDDDKLDTLALQKINKACKNENIIYIFKLFHEYLDRTIPSEFATNNKLIRFADISTQNFIVHSKFKHLINWEPIRGGDFKVINSLSEKIPVQFINDFIYYIKRPQHGK